MPLRPIDLPQEPPITDPPTRFTESLMVWLHQFLTDCGLSPTRGGWVDRIIIFLLILLIGIVIRLLCRRVILPLIGYTSRHSRIRWDSILLVHGVFRHALDLLSPFSTLLLLPIVIPPSWTHIDSLFTKGIVIYLSIIVGRCLCALIRSAFDYYHLCDTLPGEAQGTPTTGCTRPDAAGVSQESPYHSALDMSILFVRTLVILNIVGILLDLNISGLITLLSAFAALLVIIFKDTLLGFIAGMLLIRNKMVKIGDRLTVDNPTAQGLVEELSIMTIRLRDRDNTFYYVPTYALLTRTFRNWAGMKEGGAWRVARTLLVDTVSIRPLTDEDLQRILLAPALRERLSEEDYKQWVNQSRATTFRHLDEDQRPSWSTLALFRQWLLFHLAHLPIVSSTPYLIVRLAQSDGRGYPVEIYFFLKVETWTDYETAQTEIFETILPLLPLFGLRLYQLSAEVE